jgi:hypothetical protein
VTLLRTLLISLTLAAGSAVPFVSTQAAPAAPDSAEGAIALFVELNNRAGLLSAEGKRLLAGELDDVNEPGDGTLPAADRILKISEERWVARIPARTGSHPDLYFYLQRESHGWTVTAFRSLSQTGLFHEMRRLLKAIPTRDPEQEISLRNVELILSDDRTLLAWAASHSGLMDRARADPRSAEIAREFEAEGGDQVRVDDGLIILSIGSIIDNEVGFLFAPDGRVPAISRDEYIWIEPAGGGWYLFKTT